MGKSLKKRFEDQGINREYLIKGIKQRGLLPVASEMGCSLEAMSRYAEKELGIVDAEYVNELYSKSSRGISRVILEAYYDLWKNLKDENTQLKKRLAEYEQAEKKQEDSIKIQLIEMFDDLKTYKSLPDDILKHFEAAVATMGEPKEPKYDVNNPRQTASPISETVKQGADILEEADSILSRSAAADKPDNVLSEEWETAKPETRRLLCRCHELKKLLLDIYWEAVRSKDWKKALVAYQHTSPPYLFSISPLLEEDKIECLENEAKYIREAKEYIRECEGIRNKWEECEPLYG